MKSILVPIEDHGIVEPQLQAALHLGRLFDSYIEGIAITPDYPVVLPVDIAIGVPSPITPENRLGAYKWTTARPAAWWRTRYDALCFQRGHGIDRRNVSDKMAEFMEVNIE